MRVTAKVDYAVRALAELAAAGPGVTLKGDRVAASLAGSRSANLGPAAEALAIPIAALAAAMVLFGVFMAILGQNPLEVHALIYKGAFASAFSSSSL